MSNSPSKLQRTRRRAPPSPRAPKAAAATRRSLERIADALERLAPRRRLEPIRPRRCLRLASGRRRLAPVPRVNRVEMSLLKGIDRVRDMLVENTERFANGLPANNALLWGARGMGKSSLVKAVARRGQRRAHKPEPAAQARRNPSRGHREPARADGAAQRPRRSASSSFATISRSTTTTPATSRSRRRSKAASRAGRTTSSSTPPPTAAI